LHDEEFRRAIEAIKLRAPIEDVVRERVPGLKKSGNGWTACCPFHEERTPSFRVDPRRGTWHCFGACGTGGDQIGFLQRIDNLPFLEALEVLAARTGIEIPRRSGRDADPLAASREKQAEETSRAVLERAAAFFRSQIATSEGARAAAYLAERGLVAATCEGFGIGYAPASGTALVSAMRAAGVDLGVAAAVGLVRTTDEGRTYDFFRGRLVIPIRDERGRIAGFGARRLSDDDASGPKYINTAETSLFKKSRLIYALDRALPQIRREGRIVLVEGYTDVMAAHQQGIQNVVAVLGTATTEDHAALIRRTGARRATLVFDGDEAGSKAAGKALYGLLPLELDIDVVALRGGIDPCDLLVQRGAEAFRAELELARGWFEHATAGLAAFSGAALSREVDRILDLVARVRTPVHRESLLKDFAARLALPVESLREQYRARTGPRDVQERVVAPLPAPAAAPATVELDARDARAWRDVAAALLADASLIPLARAKLGACSDANLARIFAVVLELYGDEDAGIDAHSVMNRLEAHPARDRVVPLVEWALAAESPRALLEGGLRTLQTRALERETAENARLLREEERASALTGGPDAAARSTRAVEIAREIDEKRRMAASSRTE
jgi:DNA primase